MKRANPYLKEVGNKVKEFRQSKGIGIRKLGDMCNLDYANLSRFENGQIDMKLLTLKTIADALKVDVKDFI